MWEESAPFTAPIASEADFEIKPAGFVAGVPEAGGQGNVTLDVTVVERATGYEEKTTELVTVAASPGDAYANKEVPAGSPPSGNFIHVEQLEPALLKVGDKANFRVNSTSEARNFYYEVVSRDRVVFTGSTDTPEIAF